jgi:hypothetical protein
MAKNTSRKAIALAAAGSLAITGFAATPAQAAGLYVAGYVTLAPTSGGEYDVLTGNAKEFSLTANFANAAEDAGEYLKFLVVNADEDIVVDNAKSSQYSVNGIAGTDVSGTDSGANDTITVEFAAHNFKVGDVVTFTGFDNAGGVDLTGENADQTLTAVTATTVTFVAGAVLAANLNARDEDVTAKLKTPAYTAASDSFVFNTKSDNNNADKTLVLETGNITTARTATVTAWVDSNDDGDIDASEYVSDTRTVRWLTASSVTATVTIQPQIVGTTSVDARIVTTPTLNGDQMSAGDVTAKFTVQGSPTEFTASTSTWNTTDNRWEASLTRSHTINDVAVAGGTTTLTFAANHDLTVGETIITTSLNAADNGTFVITGKPAANKVSYADAASDGTDDAGTATVAVVAGAYTATAYISTTAISGKVSNSVATVAAAGGATAVTENANNNTTIDGNGDATVVVRPTTKTVSAVMTFKDSDGVAVPAGRPVVLTATTITNATGVTVNGTTVAQGGTVNAVTAAGGTVAVTVTTTSAVANDVVKVTGVAEGVAGSSTFAQWTWTAVSYTLHDVNGAGTKRSVAKGGAYSFDFLIADQWAAAQTGSLRLKVEVSGNTVSETYPTIATGRATVTVSDAQIGTSNVTVVVTPQKLQDDGTTWNGTGTAGAVTYTLYPASQTGAAVTATSADASVPFPTDAVSAGDSRLVQTAVTGDGTAGTDAIEITGVVTDSLTGVVKSGAPVTVSGASSLLFVDGTRAKFGSLTLFADENGAYSVHVRSNVAQKDSVVTVTSQGGSKTIKVTFEAADDNAGATLVIDAPAYVAAGSTFIATATLKDEFGNPVLADSANGGGLTADFKAAYSGPGLIVGTLPTKTEADGTAKVAALLGSNDKGTITVTFSYDQDGDADYADADDLVVTKTITIGTAPAAAKVNVGSFNGKLVVYANGYNGKKISWKVGGKWGTAVAASDTARFARVTPVKGVTVSVQIYVDGVLTLTKSVVTK